MRPIKRSRFKVLGVNTKKGTLALSILSATLLLQACDAPAQNDNTAVTTHKKTLKNTLIDTDAFNIKAIVKLPQTVECTLENGIQTQCAQVVLKYQPDNIEVGPFCPQTLNDVGGIWDWDDTQALRVKTTQLLTTIMQVKRSLIYLSA